MVDMAVDMAVPRLLSLPRISRHSMALVERRVSRRHRRRPPETGALEATMVALELRRPRVPLRVVTDGLPRRRLRVSGWGTVGLVRRRGRVISKVVEGEVMDTVGMEVEGVDMVVIRIVGMEATRIVEVEGAEGADMVVVAGIREMEIVE